MSVHMTALVWECPLPRDEKFILLAYADHADPYGESVYPSKTTLEWMTGYSLRSVKQITANLVRDGFLIHLGESPLGTAMYRMDVEKLENMRVGRRRPGGAVSAPVQKTPVGGCKKQQGGGAVSAPNPPCKPPENPSGLDAAAGDLFNQPKPEHPELPHGLQTPAIVAAWGEWKEHRKQKRAPLTKLATTKQVGDLVRWVAMGGERLAVLAIEHSIKNGYTGLFLPKGAEKASPPARGPITAENALRMPTKGPQTQ